MRVVVSRNFHGTALRFSACSLTSRIRVLAERLRSVSFREPKKVLVKSKEVLSAVQKDHLLLCVGVIWLPPSRLIRF